MPGPEDVGVDKQKVLKSVAEGAAAPAPVHRPPPAKPRTVAAPASPPPAPPPAPLSMWRHRHWFSTVILGTVGALWLGSGLVGKWRLGIAIGTGLLAVTVLSLALLVLRGRKPGTPK